MTFRPMTHEQALEYLRGRKFKGYTYRAISHGREGLRDSIVSYASPQEIDTGTPPVAFRQWNTDIATFYPDGRIEVEGFESATTDSRLRDMRLPVLRNLSRLKVGVKEVLVYDHNRMVFEDANASTYPLGLAGSRVVIYRRPGGDVVPPEHNETTEYVWSFHESDGRSFMRSKLAGVRVLSSYARLCGVESTGNTLVFNDVTANVVARYTKEQWTGWVGGGQPC